MSANPGVVVLDPADHRGLRGPLPRHGKAKLFSLGCRCEECVDGDRFRRAAAVQRAIRWERENPERKKALADAYRARNASAIRARSLDYYYRVMATDPEGYRAKRRDYYRTSERAKLSNRLKRHHKRGAERCDSTREWVEIILRDPCSLCGERPVEVDHIDPISLGGSGGWDNLAPPCRSCNASKNDGPLLVHVARSA